MIKACDIADIQKIRYSTFLRKLKQQNYKNEINSKINPIKLDVMRQSNQPNRSYSSK